MPSEIHPRLKLQTLIFEVTQRCNNACRYCYNVWNSGRENANSNGGNGEETIYPSGDLDAGQAKELLAKVLEEAECPHVTLTGGEPLMWKALPEILAWLQDRNVLTTVITNGRLLTEPVVEDLLEKGVGLFEVPLLSHKREVHDRLAGVPGAYDAVLAGMANLRTRHGAYIAVFVATRWNMDDLEGAIKLAFAFGARGLMLNRFNPGGRGRGYIDELLPTLDSLRAALEIANRASEKYRFPIACSIPIPPCLIDTAQFDHLGFGYCAAGTERAYYTLDPLGNIRPCNHSPTVLGNLWKQPFGEIIASPGLAEFHAAIPEICRDCGMAAECQGGCKAAAQVCYGSIFEEEPFLKANRRFIRRVSPG